MVVENFKKKFFTSASISFFVSFFVAVLPINWGEYNGSFHIGFPFRFFSIRSNPSPELLSTHYTTSLTLAPLLANIVVYFIVVEIISIVISRSKANRFKTNEIPSVK